MKITAFTLAICFCLFSCKRDQRANDQILCSTRNTNISGAINLNGYYYHEFENGESRELYFLYSNGVLVYPGGIDSANFDNVQEFLLNNSFYTNYKSSKLNWGIYSIQDYTIKLERWYPAEDKYYVYTDEGRILNDTTYLLTRIYQCNGSEDTPQNEIFHFKSFAPKPDSINSFIN